MDFDRNLVMPVFLAESEEGLATMEECLMALETRPDDAELLGELFRSAHTLKGNSSSLGFSVMAAVTHVLEDLLHRLRQNTIQATPGFVTLVLEAVDVLRGLVKQAAAGEDRAPEGLAALMDRLKAVAGGATEQAEAPSSQLEAETPANAGGVRRVRGLRVGLGKLDRLLTVAGEIAIARGRLGALLEALGEPALPALEAHRDAQKLDQEMQETVMRMRLVPLGPILRQHARTVRDVALGGGKQARLVVEGEDVEADLTVVEHLRASLTHMIRNSVDHGLETPARRRASGKDPVGTVTLRAYHEAGQLIVEVADDGAGLDTQRILAQARAAGLVGPAETPSEREIHELIFRAGLSTAEHVTQVSGRGVGMDVVRRNIAALRGELEVASRAGEGTLLTVRLPLTLAVISGFLVAAGDERFVLPLESIVECLDLPEDGADAGATGVANLRGELVPYLRVRRVLGAPGVGSARECLVVVEHGEHVAGLAVDALLGEAQVVVKPLGPLFEGLRGVSGSTILGDGHVALILDVATLMREARAAGTA